MSHTESEKRDAVGRVARRIRQQSQHTNKPLSYQESLTRAAEIARSSDKQRK